MLSNVQLREPFTCVFKAGHDWTKAMYLGIDFGTTNTALAIADDAGDVTTADFPNAGQRTSSFRSVLCFIEHDDQGRRSLETSAGPRAIADYLAQPLARLSSEQLAFIDELLAETLQKKVILQRVRDYFYPSSKEDSHAH